MKIVFTSQPLTLFPRVLESLGMSLSTASCPVTTANTWVPALTWTGSLRPSSFLSLPLLPCPTLDTKRPVGKTQRDPAVTAQRPHTLWGLLSLPYLYDFLLHISFQIVTSPLLFQLLEIQCLLLKGLVPLKSPNGLPSVWRGERAGAQWDQWGHCFSLWHGVTIENGFCLACQGVLPGCCELCPAGSYKSSPLTPWEQGALGHHLWFRHPCSALLSKPQPRCQRPRLRSLRSRHTLALPHHQFFMKSYFYHKSSSN